MPNPSLDSRASVYLPGQLDFKSSLAKNIVFCPPCKIWNGSISGRVLSKTNVGVYCVVATRRYSPLRGLTSSSCGGLRHMAEAFFALQAKKGIF